MFTGSWTYRTVPTLGWYKIFLKPGLSATSCLVNFCLYQRAEQYWQLGFKLTTRGLFPQPQDQRPGVLSFPKIMFSCFSLKMGAIFELQVWLDLFWIQKYIFPFEVGFDNCATFQTWSILKHVSAAFSNLDRTRQILQN